MDRVLQVFVVMAVAIIAKVVAIAVAPVAIAWLSLPLPEERFELLKGIGKFGGPLVDRVLQVFVVMAVAIITKIVANSVAPIAMGSDHGEGKDLKRLRIGRR